MYGRLVIVLRKVTPWGTKYSLFRPGGEPFDLTVAYGPAVQFEVADCRCQLGVLTLNHKLKLQHATSAALIVWLIFKGKESGVEGPRFCNETTYNCHSVKGADLQPITSNLSVLI